MKTLTVDWNLPCLLSVLRLIYSTYKSSTNSQKLEMFQAKFIICEESKTGTDPNLPDSIKFFIWSCLVFLWFTQLHRKPKVWTKYKPLEVFSSD